MFGRKLGRNKGKRRLLFLNITRALLENGRVKTSFAKAKAVQPLVEKLITSAKAATSSTLREVAATLADATSYKKLMEMATTRFTARTSGYTRIVRIGLRKGDASEIVYLEFVDAALEKAPKQASKEAKATKVREEAVKVEEAKVVSKEKPKRFATPAEPVRTPRKRS